jgi:sensor c-di-GMP phosphodiesterase-like protein
MSDDFEKQLRNALRPIDPAEGFADKVMSRIEREPERLRRQIFRWLPTALAASMLLGVVVIHDWQVRREAQGLEARRQLIEALRVTGQKLDLAYQAVNRESRPAGNDGSGA